MNRYSSSKLTSLFVLLFGVSTATGQTILLRQPIETRPTTGLIDEVSVLSRALSAEEAEGFSAGVFKSRRAGGLPICDALPPIIEGSSFGQVVAGQTYTYEASGCVFYSPDQGRRSDPDGNIYTDAACTRFFGTATAGSTYNCPGLNSYSLVGKIAGSECIQLGSSGSFVAPISGELVLYFNDGNHSDNSGSWDVCISQCVAPRLAWEHRTDVGPAPRWGLNSMAYDEARGVTVLFGGATLSSFFGDTWEWDGSNWTQRCVGNECGAEPAARVSYAMVYDPMRQVTVLFGGYGGADLGDTWEWNGSLWSKVDDGDPEGITAPSPREGIGNGVRFRLRCRCIAWGS